MPMNKSTISPRTPDAGLSRQQAPGGRVLVMPSTREIKRAKARLALKQEKARRKL